MPSPPAHGRQAVVTSFRGYFQNSVPSLSCEHLRVWPALAGSAMHLNLLRRSGLFRSRACLLVVRFRSVMVSLRPAARTVLLAVIGCAAAHAFAQDPVDGVLRGQIDGHASAIPATVVIQRTGSAWSR